VAHELHKAGISTLLLEATDRVGGRMYSKRWDIEGDPNRSVVIEMGAQWIHGIDHNPIYKIAKKLGLEMFATPVHTGRHPDAFDAFFSTAQDGTTEPINHTAVLTLLEVRYTRCQKHTFNLSV
jgi:monoamine oxidase